MKSDSRAALNLIRRCVASGTVRLFSHFIHRMDERGFVWADILALLDAATNAVADGEDDFGRPRWIVSGTAVDGHPMSVLCLIGRDESGHLVLFVTLFWED